MKYVLAAVLSMLSMQTADPPYACMSITVSFTAAATSCMNGCTIRVRSFETWAARATCMICGVT